MIFILDLTISDKEFIDSSYKDFLFDLKHFLHQLDNKDFLNYVRTIINMLHNGQFSLDGRIDFDNNYNYLYLPSIVSDGAYVMHGVCCCRHANALLNDILNILGFNPMLLYILIDENGNWHKESPNRANHLSLLINENEKEYILDAVNKLILQKEKNGDLISIDMKLKDNIKDYYNSSVSDVGKVLKKYYTYRDIGIECVYDYS